MDDVVLSKRVSIERCLSQIKKYRDLPSEVPFADDFLKQDAIVLNVHRACEQAIDIANHLIKVKKLGLPQDSRESFSILKAEGVISENVAGSLMAMVGFRNVLVHRYKDLDVTIPIDVIDNRLSDLLAFANHAVEITSSDLG